MKIRNVTVSALLLALAACRIVPSFPRQYTATNITTLVKVFVSSPAVPTSTENTDLTPRADVSPPAKHPKLGLGSPPAEPDIGPRVLATEPQSDWDNYVCRGEKLTQASKLEKDEAEAIALPIGTKWSGNLEAERRLWGYFDSPDPDCDFEGSYYDITKALEALGVEDGECFRTEHFDAEDEGEIKDQTYKIGDKEYHATGAHGTFGINIEQGAIFFIDIASAPRKAAQVWGVDVAPKDQLPDLRQISDIAWGFWHQAHGGSDLGHITKFIVPQIINDITTRLISQALENYDVPDDEKRYDTVPEWPGITFSIDTPPGKALLGSPIGIAVAYFLAQHKSEIGDNKYVSKITVFCPDEETGMDEPTLVYYVESAAVPSQEDEILGRGIGDRTDLEQKSTRHDLMLAADDLVSTTEDESLWEDYVCRGEKLTEACKANKDEAANFLTPIDTPWKGSMEAELDKWGYREVPAMSHCNFDDIEDALKALKISTKSRPEGGLNYCYEVRHSYEEIAMGPSGKVVYEEDQTYTVEGKTYRMTAAHAIIGANTFSGVIFFVDVKSASRAAEDLWYPEIPTSENLPKLRAISDISWAFWNWAWMKRSKQNLNLGNINYFVVHNIVNEETEQVIEQALQVYQPPEGQQRVAELPQWPGLTFDVESEAGQAMLGSPNGIAAGYFLAQHKAEIGANKYVYQVQVFATRWAGPSMILYVKDAPSHAPDDVDLPVHMRRKNEPSEPGLVLSADSSTLGAPMIPSDVVTTAAKKKLDDIALCNSCRCRGEKITEASLQDKLTAMNIVNPIDSPWEGTMEAELKLWGYAQPNGLGLYCDLDNVAGPFKEMGIDTKFKEKTKNGQNECYQAHHSKGGPRGMIKDQTYVVGEKTYRMTDAIMQMGVNARDGMIAFFNVRSAEQSAMQIWGVDEVATDDLPMLNRISDISWAFWKRAHKGDAGLSNIQKFHVHDAVNEDTLRLVNMALKTYQVPEGDSRHTRLPKWPGLIFNIETEEGKVMLGSPNGIAAGYFLVQHKTQLGGNKYIYQVTLWNDSDGDMQMMFWVKDVPPPPNKQERHDDRRRWNRDEDQIAHVFDKAGRVVERSPDGRDTTREHRVLAKL